MSTPKFKTGDLIKFPPELRGDPDDDYGLILDVVQIEYDGTVEWHYKIHWAVDGTLTLDAIQYIDDNVQLISES